MLAFHGDPKIKEKYLARVQAHRAADEVIKGQYWKNGKGCAVGCTIHGSEHSRYETELGIPVAIACLEDSLFEDLPNSESIKWPEDFLEAIPVGADLGMVIPQFLFWLLSDEEDGVIRHAVKFDLTRNAVQTVADLFAKVIHGEIVTMEQWSAAASAAASAARSAAAASALAESAAAARSSEEAAEAWSAAARSAAAASALAESAAAAWSSEEAAEAWSAAAWSSASAEEAAEAWSAAWSSASAEEAAEAWSAAESAASAEEAAESAAAAWSSALAARSAAAAWSSALARINQSKKLLELLRNAPVPAMEAL
jgi:hypothetical protein